MNLDQLDQLTESQLSTAINEAFNSAEDKVYQATNLAPHNKIPQVFKIEAPDSNIVVLMSSALDSKFNKFKTVKTGDKVLQVWFCSLNPDTVKMQVTPFEGGLGPKPILTMATVFDVVMSTVKLIKADAVVFRFEKLKIKGKGKLLQRLISRLVLSRGKGKFVALNEITAGYVDANKWDLALIHRKGIDLTSVKGIPHIDLDKFAEVTTSVGKTYVSKDTGKAVSIAQAVATTINDIAQSANAKANLAKVKMSKSAIYSSQFTDGRSTVNAETAKVLADLNKTEHELADVGNREEKTFVAKRSTNTKIEIDALDDQQVDNLATLVTGSRLDPEDFITAEEQGTTTSRSIRALKELNSLALRDKQPSEIKQAAKELYFANKQIINLRSKILSGDIDQYAGLKAIANQVRKFDDSSDEYKECLLEIIRSVTAYPDFTNQYADPLKSFKPNLDDDQQESLQAYTSDDFIEINSTLLGELNPSDKAIKHIKTLDGCFKDAGIKLSADTKLYRGQSISSKLFNTAIKNKAFYFKNYVSTSLAISPIFGFYAEAGVAVSSDMIEPVVASDYTLSKDAYIAFVISRPDRTLALVPGEYTEYPKEAEVLLPRGTLLRITAMSDPTVDNKTVLVESEVVSADELTESEIYDGDALLNTGEVKLFSIKKLYTEKKSGITSEENNYALDTLAEAISVTRYNGRADKHK